MAANHGRDRKNEKGITIMMFLIGRLRVIYKKHGAEKLFKSRGRIRPTDRQVIAYELSPCKQVLMRINTNKCPPPLSWTHPPHPRLCPKQEIKKNSCTIKSQIRAMFGITTIIPHPHPPHLRMQGVQG